MQRAGTQGLRSLRRLLAAPARGWSDKPGKPSVFVLIAALAVGAALLLPTAYLVIRSAGAGVETWELLWRVRILQILVRTLSLIGAVTTASILLAVPMAWLTVRTDLPFRTAWAVLAALPLVIPSYVFGFIVVVALGPRGMLQKLLESPLGVDRIPDISGFPGATLTLTLLSYPYVLLTVRSAF